MRGAQTSTASGDSSNRIIPADAGSTMTLGKSCSCMKGSSPQMRGALLAVEDAVNCEGIIPADAGSTLRNPCNPNNIIDKISNF